MKRYISRIDQFLSLLFFSPIMVFYRLKGFPIYISNIIKYQILNKDNLKFPIRFYSLLPILTDRYNSAGGVTGHYFLQDLHVANIIYSKKPIEHVDIASRVDGFVAHLLIFMKVVYVDIRNLPVVLNNLVFKQGTITKLPFTDNQLNSLSTLHVFEHIGLGRYGDDIDPNGHIAAARELQRVMAPGGTLYLSVPVGRERLCYDAHRIFHPQTILDLFPKMKLNEFYLIDDKGDKVTLESNFLKAEACSFGCGIFILEKQ